MDRRDFLEISPYRADEGELIGKHPGDVPSDFLCLKFRAQNPLRAIREKCLDCCCANASEVPQVRRGRLCSVAVPHGHECFPQEA
jgi:hypothetical protein